MVRSGPRRRRELSTIVDMYLGQILFGMGEYGRAIEVSKQILERFPGDLARERFKQVALPTIAVRGFLGRMLGKVGEFEDAIHHLDEAMRDAEALGKSFDLGLTHYALGEVYASRGMVERAVPILERGLALAQAGEAPFQIVVAMGWLGYAYALLGRPDEGIVFLEHSIARAEAIEFIGGMAAIITLQSGAYLRAGRGNEARAAAHRGLDLCRRLSRRGSEAETLHMLGEIAATAAPLDTDAAEAHYRDAMALAEARGMRPLVAHCHLGLGKLDRRAGNRQKAEEHLTTATTMYRDRDMRLWLSQAEMAMTKLA